MHNDEKHDKETLSDANIESGTTTRTPSVVVGPEAVPVDVESAEAAMPPAERVESSPENYPHGLKLVLTLVSIYLSVFLVALDRTIIATALPRITDDFHSFSDVGWYNGAFTLTMTAFQLFFGRIYTFYSPKWVFLLMVVVFEIGSALCGAAPNSVAFILGRAISGVGAAAIFNGAMILMMYAAPLQKRPQYMGLFGAVFGIASVAGPLLGGVFTSKVSWRWCFYINLPIGAATLVFLVFALDNTPATQAGLTFREKIDRLDLLGTAIFLPTITCLLLALQWGGQKYPWSDGRIIALFVVFGVLLIVFIGIQIWKQESATVPPRIFKQRTVAAGSLYAFATFSTFMVAVYYLAIWFQAIKGDTAIRSGLSTLPMLLGMVISSISSGILVSRIGYYVPFMILSSVLVPIGAGLLTTFKVTTAHPMWIGVEFLIGFGVGIGMQQPNVATQTVLERKDIPTGMSLVFFMQGIGATISVAIGQNILDNKLISSLSTIHGVDPAAIVNAGATNLRNAFPSQYLPQVLKLYNAAIVDLFYLATGFACLSIFGTAFMEWKSVKAKKPASKRAPVPTEKSVE